VAPATVTLWEGCLEPDDTLRDSLDDEERQQALRFPRLLDRERFTAARGTLRHILAHHLDIPPGALRFGYAAEGKPFLPDYPDLRFSLSHADDRFVVAVSRDGPLGADLEGLPDERTIDGTVARVLAEPERALFARVERAGRAGWFAEVWTRKEACVKADGRGLGADLTRLDVATAPPRVLVRQPETDAWSASPRWTVRSIPVAAGYAGAIVAEGDDWVVERVRWPGPVRLGG
jgi:4'-phosphopantetheinyl transferase